MEAAAIAANDCESDTACRITEHSAPFSAEWEEWETLDEVFEQAWGELILFDEDGSFEDE